MAAAKLSGQRLKPQQQLLLLLLDRLRLVNHLGHGWLAASLVGYGRETNIFAVVSGRQNRCNC
jgi:hypothetical protein